jgi:hypothetical protein
MIIITNAIAAIYFGCRSLLENELLAGALG